MISKKTWKAIDYILKNCPSAVFGGSIALTAVGLLNREVGDIDLFFQEGDSLTRNGFLKGEPTMNPNIGSDTITDVNGKQIQRTSVEVHGIKTCCFKIPFEQWQYSEILFNGREDENTERELRYCSKVRMARKKREAQGRHRAN